MTDKRRERAIAILQQYRGSNFMKPVYAKDVNAMLAFAAECVHAEREATAKVCEELSWAYHTKATNTSLTNMELKNFYRGCGATANECAAKIREGER